MIQERIIQYLEFKGISKYKFYKETGLSNGFLDKRGTIGVDKCELIISLYPDINLYWLILGTGSMLRGEDAVRGDVKQSTAPKPMSNSELVEYLQRRLDDKMREVFDLETKVNNLEREKKAQGIAHYGTAADKVVKYGREEK